MKLFILRPRENLNRESNPWEPWYDKTFGLVVRAESEERARALASTDESMKDAWLSSDCSSCVELQSAGIEEIIIKDQHWA